MATTTLPPPRIPPRPGFFASASGKLIALLVGLAVALGIGTEVAMFNNALQEGKVKTQEAIIKLETAAVADRRQRAEALNAVMEGRAKTAVAASAGLRQLSEKDLQEQKARAATDQADNAERLKSAEAKLKHAEQIIAENTAQWADLKTCGDTATTVWQQRDIEAKAFIQEFSNRAVQGR